MKSERRNRGTPANLQKRTKEDEKGTGGGSMTFIRKISRNRLRKRGVFSGEVLTVSSICEPTSILFHKKGGENVRVTTTSEGGAEGW